MESLLILFIHNRPKILLGCLETLFNGNPYKFDEILFINDASDDETNQIISEIVLRYANSNEIKFNLVHFAQNQGYGGASEFAFNYVKWRNPKYYFHIESDYLFRHGWTKETIEVLKASPKTLGISGYSHPDFYINNKINKDYPEAIIREYGSDPCPRELLFKPFSLKTEEGNISVQGTSNSSGCVIVNWHNFMSLSEEFPDFWDNVLMRAANKYEGNRKTYGDGPFSHGSCFYWYNSQVAKESDLSKEFAWLDICDYSLSNHICGGEDSINGYIVPEGHTFVSSPKWKNEYLKENPRKK